MVDLEKLKQCQAILAHHGGDPVYEMVPAIIAELTALRAKVAAGEALRKRVGDQYIERNSHCCDGYALRCPAHIMCIEYDAAISK